MASFTTTLNALAAPRRALPIAAMIAALVAVELAYGDLRSALVPFGMALGFLALGPWTWRALLATRVDIVRLAAYAGGGALVVAAFGVALPYALGLGTTFFTDPGSLAIAGVLYLVGGWGLGRDIELEQDLEHVRLKAIRAYFDPHFLYNTLNTIAEWCREDPVVAEDATIRLAAMLRATLEALEQRTWPIAREVALAEDLVELHRLRDPDAFTATFEVAGDGEIAPLVLVTLVENALKHGPRAGHRGPIAIRVTPHRLEVENPGGYTPTRGGRGIATLRSRLAIAYGDGARFSIGGTDRTRAVLELP